MTTSVNQDTSITFHYYAPQASQVAVVGSFNLWEAWPLENWGHGNFGLTTAPLGHKDVIYKFIVDGQYKQDPQILLTDGSVDGNSFISTGHDRGTLVHSSIYSESLGEDKSYVVYLPPGYFLSNRDYPVLYLLCGLLDYELSWHQRGKVGQVADQLISSGKMDPMIIIMPDKDEAWTTPGKESSFYQYLANEVVQKLDSRYRISKQEGSRAIEGLSIGAHWSFQVACRNPHLFSSVSLLSCPISPELYELSNQYKDQLTEAGMRVRLNCGNEEEQLIPECNRFKSHLQNLGLQCEFYVGEGTHDWPLWQKEIGNSLQFHSASFRS